VPPLITPINIEITQIKEPRRGYLYPVPRQVGGSDGNPPEICVIIRLERLS